MGASRGMRVLACLVAVLFAQGVLASGDPDCDIRHQKSDPVSTKATVMVGERFSVCLTANPSTGYSWAMPFGMSNGLERLVYLGTSYRPGAAEAQGLVGVPGTSIFHFAAARPGMVSLAMTYLRPWLWHEAPAESTMIEITIMSKPE